jgi:hypothetical protein
MAPAPIPPARTPVAESPAEPPGRATGTLTIGGVTATLNHAYGAVRRDPASAAREYIVVLLTDRPVPAEDRLPAALSTLAQNDRVRAVRLAWRADSDDVLVALYHRDLVQSGLAFRGQSNLSVNALSATRIDAEVASKNLGQPWAFQAAFAADLARGGVATIEPLAARSAASTGGPGPTGPIGELARRRLEFTEDSFFHTIVQGDVEAVRLFLRAGMSPNVSRPHSGSALMMAISVCTRAPVPAHNDIVLVLIEAGADVNVRDGNNSTPLIWAADKCGPQVIQALIRAGGDVNARANGGATPLMMAEVMGRTEIAGILREAGARPWGPPPGR